MKDIFDSSYTSKFGDDCHIIFEVNINKLIMNKDKEPMYKFLYDKISQYKEQNDFWEDIAKKITISVQNIIEERIGKLLSIILNSKRSGDIRNFSKEFIDKYGEKLAIYKMIYEKKK
jgi:hypothetical protein